MTARSWLVVLALLLLPVAAAGQVRMEAGPPLAPIAPLDPERGATAPPRVVVMDGTNLEQALDGLLTDLAGIRTLAEEEPTPQTRRALLDELASLRGRILELRRTVRAAPAGISAPSEVVVVGDPEAPPDAPPGDTAGETTGPGATPPMGREEFDHALAELQSHGFASERMEVLSRLSRQGWFAVDQARRLLEAFPFGKDRLEALELLAPRLVDPENHFRLYEAFTFESDKKQARRILSAQQP